MHPAARRKQRERFLLERFLSVAKIDAQLAAVSESPDFEIAFDGRAIGVEITEIFAPAPPNQHPLQARESLSSRVVASARRRYDRAGGVPVHLSVLFSAGDLRTVQRESLAEALAQLLLRLAPTQGKHTLWRNDYKDEELAPWR